MDQHSKVTRRQFVGGLAATIGAAQLANEAPLAAQTPARQVAQPAGSILSQAQVDAYDSMAKLASNENPYGPTETAMKAFNYAFKYANRYGYPDGGIQKVIADHHGVKTENILLGAGSGEILKVVGTTYLLGGKKVLGFEPTYSTVYQQASGLKTDSIKLQLTKDYRQDIPTMVKAAKANYRDLGFIYLCNPNNPTGVPVSKQEIKQLLDEIPQDLPVLIDEAYHHFAKDPSYAPSVNYVIEGRQVIIARTFSKVVGMAAMRLGYAIAPKPIIDAMKPFSAGEPNVLAKWGAVASFTDTAAHDKLVGETIRLRQKAIGDLQALGYASIPSDANFFMVHLKTNVVPVIEEFRKRGVAVGRPFPPMTEHLRVSIGTPEEMDRFMVAFKDIFNKRATAAQG